MFRKPVKHDVRKEICPLSFLLFSIRMMAQIFLCLFFLVAERCTVISLGIETRGWEIDEPLSRDRNTGGGRGRFFFFQREVYDRSSRSLFYPTYLSGTIGGQKSRSLTFSLYYSHFCS